MESLFTLVLTFVSTLHMAPMTSSNDVELERFKLVEIKSQPENNRIHNMYLDVGESGEIVKIVRESDGVAQVIDINAIISGEVVLAKADDRDALIISCPGCSIYNGGTLNLKYLDNGITNKYSVAQFKLQNPDAVWELRTQKNTHVNNLTLVSRTFLGKLIGIKEIAPNLY